MLQYPVLDQYPHLPPHTGRPLESLDCCPKPYAHFVFISWAEKKVMQVLYNPIEILTPIFLPPVDFGFTSGNFSDILSLDEVHIDLMVAPAVLAGAITAVLNITKFRVRALLFVWYIW